MVVVLAGLMEVVVTQLVEDHPLEVGQVKLGVHQRVDINVAVIQVVTAPGRLEPGIEKDPVGKGPVEGRQ